MKPTDYRDMTWEQVQQHLVDDWRRVYDALMAWGPVTVRRLANLMDRDLLSVPPRVSDLCRMGLAEVVEVSKAQWISDGKPRGGYYRAIPMAEAEHRRRYGNNVQAELKLGGV